jgi:large subunit ribosomal protein L25
MEKLTLTAQPRTVVGKKVKTLRKEGIVPGNIFGKDFKSTAIQISEKDFRKIFKEAGETGIVEVKVKDQTYPALIHKVQKDPLSNKQIHVDFHKINLKEKIDTHVPVKMVGESQAEKSGLVLILQTLSELEIESLPTDIPHEIEVDISNLQEVGQTIHVKDLKIDRDKVEVINEPEAVVISVQTAEMKEEKVEEAVSPAEVEATGEKGEEAEEGAGEESKEGKSEIPEAPKEEPQEQK